MISTASESTLWATTKDSLRGAVSRQDFDNCFEGMSCLGRDGDTLVLRADSLMAEVWVNTNHRDVLSRHLSLAAGRTLAVRVVAPESESVPAPVADAPRVRVSVAENLPPPPAIKPANTFENFIVGPENDFAHAAAAAVADNPGYKYNPLLVYGNTGLGKTHLMHAVAHTVMRKTPKSRIVYVTSEAFTDEFLSAVRAPGDAEKYQKTNEFKKKYRDVDVLLIDDIQFLAGKAGTQEEFFNIFNHLHLNHKQVIITSDKPVKEINGLADRLVSRFHAGMIADVQAPGLETRMAIVERKARTMGISLSREVVEFIATRIVRNVRNIEGAIMRVSGYVEMGKGERELTVPRLEQLLHHILVDEGATRVTAEEIMRKVAEQYSLSLAEMTGKRRTANIAWPRQIAMFLCTRLTDLPLVAIGEAFGGRDHGTVIHARKTVEGRMQVDPKEKRAVELLLNRFGVVHG